MTTLAMTMEGWMQAAAVTGTPEAVRTRRPSSMDEAAFRSLYARTARRLRGYLAGAVRDPALTDDLLQEAYYRLLRSGPRNADEEHRVRYLYRIATNLVRDHFRRWRPEVEVGPEHRAAAAHEPTTNLRSDMESALAELGRRDRQMLWLAYVEGMTHAEIGEVMDLKPASLRSMLFRARQRLAEVLRERGLAPASGGAP